MASAARPNILALRNIIARPNIMARPNIDEETPVERESAKARTMIRVGLAAFLVTAFLGATAPDRFAAAADPGETPDEAKDLPAPPPESDAPRSSVPDSDAPRSSMPESDAPRDVPGRFVAETIDSTYFVEPAEFFSIELPVTVRGARAVHLFGDVSVQGRRDVIARLFTSDDYKNWLKRRGGRVGKPFWSSPRSRSIRIDQDLPQARGIVLLLDNGYSLRTPKRVRVQLQMQYEGGPPGLAGQAAAQPASVPQEGDVVPRANTEEDFPPPPPPPDERPH